MNWPTHYVVWKMEKVFKHENLRLPNYSAALDLGQKSAGSASGPIWQQPTAQTHMYYINSGGLWWLRWHEGLLTLSADEEPILSACILIICVEPHHVYDTDPSEWPQLDIYWLHNRSRSPEVRYGFFSCSTKRSVVIFHPKDPVWTHREAPWFLKAPLT